MKNMKMWIWPLALGSMWGIMELAGGGSFYKNNVPFASVWLSAWAVFTLSVARGIINKPGTSTAAGATAALFKLVYAAPFYCHVAAIFCFGLFFDIAATLLLKEERPRVWRPMLTGVVTAYGGYASFAILMTYVARYKYWVMSGPTKLLNHIFIGGTMAAIVCLIVAPLGLRVGRSREAVFVQRPGRSAAWAVGVILVLWIVGKFIS